MKRNVYFCNMTRHKSVIKIDMLGQHILPETGAKLVGVPMGEGYANYYAMQPSRSGIMPDLPSSVLWRLCKEWKTPIVGLFKNEMFQHIITAAYNYKLEYIQLDGQEAPCMIDNLRHTLVPDIRPSIKIMKRIAINTEEDMEKAMLYTQVADNVILAIDSLKELNLVRQYNESCPFILDIGTNKSLLPSAQLINNDKCKGINIAFTTQNDMEI